MHGQGVPSPSFPVLLPCGASRSDLSHSAWHIEHMHKALDQMNLQIHRVIADITGTRGTAIIESILDGRRDPTT